MKVGYLLKKFPRLSETFILGEILEQERLGTDVHIFSRHVADDEPRHPGLARLKAEIEILPSTSGTNAWLELFQPESLDADLFDRIGAVVRDLAYIDNPRLPAYFAEALHLLRRTRELGIEHLHIHFATNAALVAMILHRLGGPTYSITAHAKDIYRSTVDRKLLSQKIVESEFTVTVCDANVQHLEDILTPEAIGHVRRLYNGIDLSVFRPNGRARNRRHVLAVGRLVEKKGFDVLIDAISLLTERGVECSAAIIGQGDERANLEARIERLGLRDRVELLGALDQGAVRERMGEAGAMCLPCMIGEDGNRDALPTVLLEAQAAGLPVISTPVTGIPEIVDHGRAGVLVPENDARATAEALQELFENDERWRTCAERGRQRAEELFDGRRAAGTLRGWFQEALSQVACT